MTDREAFALWLTGLPASGKSSVARELAALLRGRGIPVVVLGSDEMRTILTPDPVYSEEERARFYRQLVQIGAVIVRSGVNVIFDATANRRAYRDHARQSISRFLEIAVACPLEVCRKRDPKGIYARAAGDMAATVPGLQVPYEPPLVPEIVIDGQDRPDTNAARILEKLKQFLYI